MPFYLLFQSVIAGWPRRSTRRNDGVGAGNRTREEDSAPTRADMGVTTLKAVEILPCTNVRST